MKIQRAYTRKVFAKQYEATDFYCAAEEEVNGGSPEEVSRKLQAFCESQVEADVRKFLGVVKPEDYPKPPKAEPKDFKPIEHNLNDTKL